MATCAALLKFMLTNFKFELAHSAIFQYGSLRGNLKMNLTSYNIVTSALTLN